MNYADTLAQTLTSPAEFAEATEAMFHDAFLTDADIDLGRGSAARLRERRRNRDRAAACLQAMMRISQRGDRLSGGIESGEDATIASHLYALCQAYAERNSDEEYSV